MQTPFKKIILATDFLDTSKEASYYAMNLARSCKVRLLKALHVFDISAWDVSPSYFFNIVPKKLKYDGLTEEAKRISEREKGNLTGLAKSFGLDLQIICVTGTAGEEIVHYAKDSNTDLLILGTHGYTGLKRYMLGSVAEFVVRNASCPVLTIRH